MQIYKTKTGELFYLSSMNILLVAATRPEVAPLLQSDAWHSYGAETANHDASSAPSTAQLLVTGVGIAATAYALGRHLATHQYDLAVNLGIAGSFDRRFALGDVLEVTQDTFAEQGAEDDTRFLSLDDLGFGITTYRASTSLSAYYDNPGIVQATAITASTAHGNELSIAALQQRLQAQLESMEGAAFFYACQQAGLPAIQIRAVSNYVEKRNRENWKIGLAVKNLNTFAAHLLESLMQRANI